VLTAYDLNITVQGEGFSRSHTLEKWQYLENGAR